MTQEEALDILKTGANVFLTGEPGSGKTYTVNRYVEYLRSCGIEPAITASTGIAATHIGGMTVHSWSGIGIKHVLTKHDLDAIRDKTRAGRRVMSSRVLVIDEISMLSADTFSAVEKVCRELRDPNKPFGGLQVVLVGDFFQLPPVRRREEPPGTGAFAFRAEAWRELAPTVCYLSEQHRQDDGPFFEALGAIRRGPVLSATREYFSVRASSAAAEGVTKLFSHNADVDRINDAELAKLPGEARVFAMRATGARAMVEAMKRSCLSPEVLTLKVGAKVMFTRNNPEGRFVNGTTGEVEGFSEKEGGYPIVRTRNGASITAEPAEWMIEDGVKVLAHLTQVPLRLAWAITVHKSQGMSLDAAVVDLSSAFEHGQGYVALSRVRSREGLHLLGINERALQVHPEVAAEDFLFRAASDIAREKLRATDPGALHAAQEDFIRRSGGTPGKGRAVKEPKKSTYEKTKELVLRKMPIPAIAEARGITVRTITGHLEQLLRDGGLTQADIAYARPEAERFHAIKEAFQKTAGDAGDLRLTPVRALLGNDFSFDELAIARLFLADNDIVIPAKAGIQEA